MAADEHDKPNRRSSAELSVDDILGPGFAEKLSGAAPAAPAEAAVDESPPLDAAEDVEIPDMDDLQDDALAEDVSVEEHPLPPMDDFMSAPMAAETNSGVDALPSVADLADVGEAATDSVFAPSDSVLAPPTELPEEVTLPASAPEPPAPPVPMSASGAPLPPGMGGPSLSGPIPAPRTPPKPRTPAPMDAPVAPPAPTPFDATEATTNAGGSLSAPPAPSVVPPPSTPMEDGAPFAADSEIVPPPPPGSTGAPLPGAPLTGRISPPPERVDPPASPFALDNLGSGSAFAPAAQVPEDDAVVVSEAAHVPAPPPDALAAANAAMGQVPFAPIPDDAVELPEEEHAPAPPAAAVAAASAVMGDIPAPPIPDDAIEIDAGEHAAPPPPEALAAASTALDVLPAAPAAEGTPWSEDVAAPMAVDTSDIQRLSTTELEDLALPGKVPRFPSAAVNKAVREVRAWLFALPILHKATLVVVLAVLVGVGMLLSSGGFPYPGWVTGEMTLRVGPNNEAFPAVAELERNDPVTVLDDEGGALMVRDHLGRVGWLPFSGVAAQPAEVTPKNPFTRCKPRVTEPDATVCEQRAIGQGDECKAYCDSAPDAAQCGTLCEQRTTDCKASCSAPPTVEEDPPPTGEAPIDLIAGSKEGADGPDASSAETEEEDPKPAVKKKKKTKRRKKRRRK